MDEVSAELSSTEDNPRENNCRKVFEKAYDIIQIEVSRKKLESSTSVASMREERDKEFYRFGGAAPNRVIKPRKQTLTLDGKKERAILAERKMNTLTVHFNGLKNER